MAVLPFRNIGHSDDSYFGEGITEDIITGLSRSRSLYVVSRNSTLRYSESNVDIREIANDLDVRYVLDGSVRRQSNRLRINAELIQADASEPCGRSASTARTTIFSIFRIESFQASSVQSSRSSGRWRRVSRQTHRKSRRL